MFTKVIQSCINGKMDKDGKEKVEVGDTTHFVLTQSFSLIYGKIKTMFPTEVYTKNAALL